MRMETLPLHLPAARRLPALSQLVGAGTVLCVYRSDQGSELDGWACARSAQVGVAVHTDGVLEWLCFRDHLQRPCWHLYRLPVSESCGWDAMVDHLPCASMPEQRASAPCALWRRLRRHVLGERWASSLVAFHLQPVRGEWLLGATLCSLPQASVETVAFALRHAGVPLPRGMPSDSAGMHDPCLGATILPT